MPFRHSGKFVNKVGQAESFVRFDCENCGYRFTVSDNYSGKNIRCPNCNYIIFIEKPQSSGTTQVSEEYSTYGSNSTTVEELLAIELPGQIDYGTVNASSLLNIQEQNILKHQQRQEYIAAELVYESEEEIEEEPIYETTDPAAYRKVPWFIDMFLYPFNWPGLKHLALFIYSINFQKNHF